MAPLPPPPPPPPRLPPPPPPPPRAQAASGSIVRNHYDHRVSRWGLGDAFASMGVFFGVSLVLGLAVYVITDDEIPTGAWLPLVIVVPAVLQLLHLRWVARAKGAGLPADLGLRGTWSDLGIGVGLAFGGLVAAGVTAVLTFELLDEEPTATAAELVEDSEGGGGLTIWIYLVAVLVATLIPLVEELVYRGLWWSALEKRGMHPGAILVLTSAIFAAVHLEPIRIGILFVLGLAIGLGRLLTGRIAASIVAHMGVNAIGMIGLLVELR